MAAQCTMHNTTPFHRHAVRLFAGLLLVSGSAGLGAQELAVADPAAAPLGELVRKFTDAQVQRDAAALRALTSEQYVEVSPVGELDAREKMLGFYVKDASRAAPALAIDEWVFRPMGDSAVVIAKLNFTMTAGGQARSFAMRSSFVARKEGGQWKMLSSQHTPIRPPAPKP